MAKKGRKRTGERVVERAFGASLYEQGRGYYVALELFALLRGSLDATGEVLPTRADFVVRRRTHDFARRLLVDPGQLSSEEMAHLVGEHTMPTLRALLRSLTVPVPGRRSRPKWGGEHFLPFVGDLIHYDAVERRGKVSLERYMYRGAGGLAHKILRTDPDSERLGRSRSALLGLVADSPSSLGQLAHHLTELDREGDAKDGMDWTDNLEAKSDVDSHRTVWIDRLRDGVHNIAVRTALAPAKRVEALMHWVPYCIARHQLDLAAVVLGHSEPLLPIDARAGANAIRSQSHRVLEKARWSIEHALKELAQRLASGEGTDEASEYAALLDQKSQKWRQGSRNFFTGTLAVVGGLNATHGRRHFTLRLPLLYALVLAVLRPGEELPFENFCEERMFEQLRLVVDANSATRAQLQRTIDSAEFEDNSERLASDLGSLGLLDEYSDATRLVRGEA